MAYPANHFELLLDQGSKASQVARLSNALVNVVFNDISPAYDTAVGQTVRLIMPSVTESDCTDIGSGAVNVTACTELTSDILIDHKFSVTKQIQQFDQVRAGDQIAVKYLQPMIENIVRKADATIAGLLSATTLTASGKISGTGSGHTFARADFVNAWGALQTNGVPDDDDLHIVMNIPQYQGLLNDVNFIQEQIVGNDAAVAGQQKALVSKIANANVWFDKYLPNPSSGVYGAIMVHRYCIAMRTAVEPKNTDAPGTEVIVYPRPNLPIKLEMWGDRNAQGRFISASLVCGMKVARGEWGQYLETV